MANLLSDTINFIQPYCRYQSASVGVGSMPIIGIGNIVRNIVLAAPFTWRFNRNSTVITTVVGQQDYSVTLTDLGFLEKASALAPDGKYYEFKDVKNNEALAVSTTAGRPMSMAVESDNGSGNFTIRMSPVPDNVYTVNVIYQKAPVQFSLTSDGWSPIPDAFSDIYNNMTLGYYMDSCQDPRAGQYIQRGVAGLLARATGLTSTDKAIFMQSYLNLDMATMLNALRTQQGQAATASR